MKLPEFLLNTLAINLVVHTQSKVPQHLIDAELSAVSDSLNTLYITLPRVSIIRAT